MKPTRPVTGREIREELTNLYGGKPYNITETDGKIVDSLIQIAQKFGLTTEYDAENNFLFRGVQVGEGSIISDEISLALAKLGVMDFGIGDSVSQGILKVSWDTEVVDG